MAVSQRVYVVTDIEADGPDPTLNSMLSFASVAVDEGGSILSTFEAVLEPRPDRTANPDTMAWWRQHPEGWRAATTDPRPPSTVMADYASWLEALPWPRVFAARPLIFDGAWIDAYLKTYLDGARLFSGPFPGRRLFEGSGVDLPSLMGGALGWPYDDWLRTDFPDDWLGGHAHTHRAIDDAMGYAHLLARLLDLARSQPTRPEDFRRTAR